MIKFFIYKPYMASPKLKNINPNLLYTMSGQTFPEWQRDEQTLYDHKVSKIKEKINKIPEHKVLDWWR